MNPAKDHRQTKYSNWTLAGVLVVFLTTGVADSRAQTNQVPSGSRKVLTIFQADTVGQIFIANEKPGEEEEPGKNILVQVVIPENEQVVYETRSNNQGGYVIPRINPGIYRLHVGALQIPLIVASVPPTNPQLPKVVITIIPREMARRN